MNTIEINGVEYPCKFGLKPLRQFCEKYKFTPEQIQNIRECLLTDLYAPVDFLYFGLKYGAEREGKEFTLTFDDLEHFFSDNRGLYAALISVYGESQAPPVEDKKKAEGSETPSPGTT